VALRHHPKDIVDLRVNGAAVSALNYDGMLVNAARTVALSTWSGVNIQEGDNLLELRVRDAQGTTLKEERRTIHYASRPIRALFDPTRSRLVADGKTRPVIAVRMLDKDGHPARRPLETRSQPIGNSPSFGGIEADAARAARGSLREGATPILVAASHNPAVKCNAGAQHGARAPE